MNLSITVAIFAWFYILDVLKRAKLPAYYFVCGSCGILVLMIIFLLPTLTQVFTELLCVGMAGTLNTMSAIDVSYEDGTVFLYTKQVVSVINIGYELSGVLELLSFSAILWFFPLFKLYERLIWQVVSLGVVYLASLLRLLVQGITMVLSPQKGTQNAVQFFVFTLSQDTVYNINFLVQNFAMKLVFYWIVICLYFVCFTGKQVRAQRFGGGL